LEENIKMVVVPFYVEKTPLQVLTFDFLPVKFTRCSERRTCPPKKYYFTEKSQKGDEEVTRWRAISSDFNSSF
jgi:hypothetical protein